MGTKTHPSKYDALPKAKPDEPYFVLLGRDPLAGDLVRKWATKRHAEGEAGEIVMEALSIANEMDQYQLKLAHPEYQDVHFQEEG